MLGLGFLERMNSMSPNPHQSYGVLVFGCSFLCSGFHDACGHIQQSLVFCVPRVFEIREDFLGSDDPGFVGVKILCRVSLVERHFAGGG